MSRLACFLIGAGTAFVILSVLPSLGVNEGRPFWADVVMGLVPIGWPGVIMAGAVHAVVYGCIGLLLLPFFRLKRFGEKFFHWFFLGFLLYYLLIVGRLYEVMGF